MLEPVAGCKMTEPAYLLVLLEQGAVAFCHDENPWFHACSEPRWIEPDLLSGIVDFAEESGKALMFVLGRSRPPKRIERVMGRIDHAKIVPFGLHDVWDNVVVVVESEDRERFAELGEDWARSLILRIARRDLAYCSDMVERLVGRFGRLALHLRGIEYFGARDVAIYARELDRIAVVIRRLYEEGRPVETNVLTDRLMLSAMRNCDAGITHVTIAPDGRCYICPADCAIGHDPIGHFDAGSGLVIAPPAGLTLSRSPLCLRCDAFHCKRCVHLSRRLTGEANVPSEQQCLIAHAEREASRRLLQALGPMEPFDRLPRLPDLDYRDPLSLAGARPPDRRFGL